MPLHENALVGGRSAAVLGKKIGRFLLVGGICTLLQYLVLAALVEWFGWPATPASTLGYALSSGVNYLLSYTFTFQSSARHRSALPKFVVLSGSGLVLNGLVTYAGTTLFGWHYLVAQTAATGVTLLWNFFGNLLWTF